MTTTNNSQRMVTFRLNRLILIVSVNLILTSATFGQGSLGSHSTDKSPIENSSTDNPNFLHTLLARFEVDASQRDAQIEWSTLFEVNYYHYSIERTVDLVLWKSIYEIDGAGNPSGESIYSWVDKQPAMGTSYYRLKMEDIDGNVEYSTVKSFSLDNSESNVLVAYPNPVNDYLIVEGTASDLTNLSIVNAFGLEVNAHSTTFLEDANHLGIDVSNLRTGYYYIKTATNVVKISKL